MHRSLLAIFDALPAHEKEVRRLMLGLAAKVRKEDGNIVFQPYEVPGKPRRFIILEVYDDDEAFRRHLLADYVCTFNNSVKRLVAGGAATVIELEEVARSAVVVDIDE